MTSPIVSVRSLTKSYEQGGTSIPVLRDLEFDLAPGETAAVLGQSGSGKSTFLSLLAGLDSPTSGQVVLDGQEIFRLNELELARFRARKLGIVFQQFHLMSYLNALENVSLPLEISGDPEAETKARLALSQVGLDHRFSHLPAQLSGGEKQRVAIARALVIQPKLLLADEPSGSLDPKTGDEVLNILFQQVQAHSTSMILVTHNESLAQRCHRQFRLRDGKLQK